LAEGAVGDGELQGLVTLTDVLTSIVGDLLPTI